MTKTLLLAAALLAQVPAFAAGTDAAQEVPPAPPAAKNESSAPEAEAKTPTPEIGQSPFRVRTSRPSYPESEVARPLAIEKEWAEFGLTYRYRKVTQYTDVDGEVQDALYDYTHSWLTLDMRYGFTRNLTMYMVLPFSVGTSRTGAFDGEGEESTISDSGMGDVNFGLLWQFVTRESRSALTAVAVQLDTKQPSGNESTGAPGDRHIPLGTGTTNAGLYLHAKQRIGPVAAVARVGYVRKFSGTTMWARDLEGPLGLNGRFKPGDEITAGARLIVQPIALVGLEGGAEYVSRGPAAIGPTSDGISPGDDVVEMRDSDFEALNAAVRVMVEPSVNWTIAAGATIPMSSRNSQAFFPLEDLSQSYGTTITAAATFRW